MKLFIALSLLIFSLSVHASTPPEYVDQIDKAREGNLSQRVVQYYKKNLAVACDVNNVVRVDALKLSSSSSNEEKTLTTLYT